MERDFRRAAGVATTKSSYYLASTATVVDAEMLRVALAWEKSPKVVRERLGG